MASRRSEPAARLALAAVAVLVLALSAACLLPPANTPRGVAEAFLREWRDAEYRRAGEWSTDTSRQYLLLKESLKPYQDPAELARDRGKDIVIESETIDGERAVVRYHLGTGTPDELELSLVRGRWLVEYRERL